MIDLIIYIISFFLAFFYIKNKYATYMIYKCPVCKGRGVVSQGFYNFSRGSTTTEVFAETCKSCKGKGIIKDIEVISNNTYLVGGSDQSDYLGN